MTIFSINSGSFGDVTVTGIVSASTLKGDGSQITSVSYDNIASKPTLISSSTQVEALLPGGTLSSSAQVDITNTTGYSTFSGSLATIDTTQTNRLNTIESFTGSYATTGSNTFTGAQTFSDTTNTTSYLDGAIHIAGGMSVRQDVRISGSMTINGLLTAVSMSTQYVTSSQYNVGTSRITLNDDDNVRFAGLSIIDSGSSSPTSASILWDSLQHRFIYENLSGSSYNSSIIIAGPKHTGSLGDEPTLTSGYVPYATGGDHIDNSVIFQTGSSIGIGTNNPGRKLDVESAGVIADFTSTTTQALVDIIGTSNQLRLGTFSGTVGLAHGTSTVAQVAIDSFGQVGIGTASPGYPLQVDGASTAGFVTPIVAKNPSTNAASAAKIAFDAGGTVWGEIGASYNSNAPYMAFFVRAGSEKMRIDDSGRLGIGTTSPVNRLTVSGSADFGNTNYAYVGPAQYGALTFPRGQILFSNTNTQNQLYLAANAYNNASGVFAYRNSSQLAAALGIDVGAFSFLVAGTGTADAAISWTTAMLIANGGNVGIGTTGPNAKLEVVGRTISTNVVVGAYGTLNDTTGTSQTLQFGNYSAGAFIASSADAYIYKTSTVFSGLSAQTLIFQTRSDTDGGGFAWVAGSTPAVKMYINSSGNVGIGTTDPGSKLELLSVAPSADRTLPHNVLTITAEHTNAPYSHFGGAVLFKNRSYTSGLVQSARIRSVIYDDGAPNNFGGGFWFETTPTPGGALTPSVVINYAGNVGIGTTNPANLLHVKSSGNYGTIISDNSTNTGGGAFGVRKNGSAIGYLLNKGSWYGDTTNDLCVAAETGFNFRIYTNGSATEKFIFTAGGNFGIGTTSPGEKLEVNGSVYVNAEDSGFIIDAGGSKRVGLIKLAGHEGNIVRATGQDFGITRASTSDIRVATSLVYDVYVDGSGRVTKQNQPAFLVYSAGFSVTGGTWQIISDDLTSVSYNIGSHFNTSNGRFTAPVAGRYYFYAGGWASSTSEGSRYAMSATINGGSQLYLTGGDYCNVDSPLAGYAVTFNLNANDYVELQCFTSVSTQWGGGHYLYFGGYLLG